MRNEINNTPSEFNTPIQSTEDVAEFRSAVYVSNSLPASQKSYDELNEKAGKKRSKAVARLLTSAAVLAIVAAMFLPATGTNINAEFVSIVTTDTTVYYQISITDLTEGDDISVVLYNDFTHRVQPIDSLVADGEIANLKPGVSYTIAVKSGNRTVIKQTVRTKNS